MTINIAALGIIIMAVCILYIHIYIYINVHIYLFKSCWACHLTKIDSFLKEECNNIFEISLITHGFNFQYEFKPWMAKLAFHCPVQVCKYYHRITRNYLMVLRFFCKNWVEFKCNCKIRWTNLAQDLWPRLTN